MTDKHGKSGGHASDRTYDLDGINDAIAHTSRDQELLVRATDREGGPCTAYVRVPKAEVEAKCRAGFRRITGGEHNLMLGEAEDDTADWSAPSSPSASARNRGVFIGKSRQSGAIGVP